MRKAMDEDEVVHRMVRHLRRRGYTIESFSTSGQRGYDIVARQNGTLLIVEAKGATPSKNTKRVNENWAENALSNSLAQAILRVMEASTECAAPNQSVEVAIAVPDDPYKYYRETIQKINHILAAAGIKVYLVSKRQVKVM